MYLQKNPKVDRLTGRVNSEAGRLIEIDGVTAQYNPEAWVRVSFDVVVRAVDWLESIEAGIKRVGEHDEGRIKIKDFQIGSGIHRINTEVGLVMPDIQAITVSIHQRHAAGKHIRWDHVSCSTGHHSRRYDASNVFRQNDFNGRRH